MSLATLLVLADGRLPAGGHAHSGGLEAAVAAGRVRDVAALGGFLRGRLWTTGAVTAAFAACACVRTDEWALLDAGLDARTPSPALRNASRAQGRALLRAGRAMWPGPPIDRAPETVAGGQAARAGIGHDPVVGSGGRAAWAGIGRDPHHPVALGAVAAAAGLGPMETAVAAAHGTVTGPASAAVRLLGLDPYAVHALLARLAPECDRVAAEAAARTGDPVDALPAAGAPLLDVGAEVHATWEVRLFAS
jgi:urease accessory protein